MFNRLLVFSLLVVGLSYAQYPASNPTIASLGNPVDNAQTTLTASVTDVATVLPVTSTTGFAVDNILVLCIESTPGFCVYPVEHVHLLSFTSNTMTVTRAVDGTTGTGHAANTVVACRITAKDWIRLRDEIIAGAPFWGTNTSSVVHGIPGFFGGNDFGTAAPLVIGAVLYYAVPFGCTIGGWDMIVDTGTAVVDVWKIASGTGIPTIANTITGSATPAVTTGHHVTSLNATGWSDTVIAPHDALAFYLKDVTGSATQANLVLKCQ